MRRHIAPARFLPSPGRWQRALSAWERDFLGPETGSRIREKEIVNKLWQELFEDPSQWWDHRSAKLNTRYPDFKHKHKKKALWLNAESKPLWVDAKLAAMAPGTISASLFSWNRKLTRHVNSGQYERALGIFEEMIRHSIIPDKLSLTSVLKACASLGALEKGRNVHFVAMQTGCDTGVFMGNNLINMYAKCRSMEDAAQVFNKMLIRDVVSWNTMILGYVKCGQSQFAVELYDKMPCDPDSITFVGILNACASLAALDKGRSVHEQVISHGCLDNVYVSNSLVDMYAKCGAIDDARGVFDLMPARTLVSWSAMILGYTHCEEPLKALELAKLMRIQDVQPTPPIFVGLLNASASLADLAEGKRLHDLIRLGGCESDIFVGSALIDMYAKCGSIAGAREVFNRLPRRDCVIWTSMIQAYEKCGQGNKAVELFAQLLEEGLRPDIVTCKVVLKACGSISALKEGKDIHEWITQAGLDSNLFVANSLIDMYTKCGSMSEALGVFDNLVEKDVVSWTTMIQGYGKCGQPQESVELFQTMLQGGVKPDTLASLVCLSACSRSGALDLGKKVHKEITARGWESDFSVNNGLIDMYSKCGSMEDAQRVFEKMPARNVGTWNAIIQGYVNSGLGDKALELFLQMKQNGVEPSPATFVEVLGACTTLGLLAEGRCIHEQVVRMGFEPDVLVSNSLLDMYTKCGSLEEALTVFHKMPARNVDSWNAVIQGYLKHGQWPKVLDVYQQMQKQPVKPTPVTFLAVINALAHGAAIEDGKNVHKQILQSECMPNIFLSNSLIHMYTKFDSIDDAWWVFESMPDRDVVSWNSIIQGYAKCGHGRRALVLGEEMYRVGVAPDHITFVGLLNACASLGDLAEGRRIHELVIKSCHESNGMLKNSLIDMYSKCGSIDDAVTVFNEMTTRDVVSWNSLIQGFVKCGRGEKALQLSKHMQAGGIVSNEVTLVGLLTACASTGALEDGRRIHDQIIRRYSKYPVPLGTSLIDMYAKCGSLEDALAVFKEVHTHNLVSWTAMLGGFAMHGQGIDAISCFYQICQEGFEPDQVTFVSLLSACSHAGLVDEGLHFFGFMKMFCPYSATVEHYACMVDLLGRAGRLHEAEDLIESMCCDPDTRLWLALLGACRVHGNVEMGERTTQRVRALEPGCAAGNVLLSNIYAAAGKWKSSASARQVSSTVGAFKQPGRSWIEVNREMHLLKADDQDHPQIAEIHAELDKLYAQMEDAGYIPDTSFVLHDLSENEKLVRLRRHSEKLAIAYGLISTPPNIRIRIFKNLRMCGDCHTAAKFISKLAGRALFVRDAVRFHHFEGGICSCGDYW